MRERGEGLPAIKLPNTWATGKQERKENGMEGTFPRWGGWVESPNSNTWLSFGVTEWPQSDRFVRNKVFQACKGSDDRLLSGVSWSKPALVLRNALDWISGWGPTRISEVTCSGMRIQNRWCSFGLVQSPVFLPTWLLLCGLFFNDPPLKSKT